MQLFFRNRNRGVGQKLNEVTGPLQIPWKLKLHKGETLEKEDKVKHVRKK